MKYRVAWVLWSILQETSMMTSSNGSIFRVTGTSWVEFTGHRWLPENVHVMQVIVSVSYCKPFRVIVWYDTTVLWSMVHIYHSVLCMYTRIGKPVYIKRCFSDRRVQTGILIASLTANNAYFVWHHLGFKVYLIIQYGTFDTKQADILAQAKCYSDWNRIVVTYTVKPVCNDHLYNKIYYL